MKPSTLFKTLPPDHLFFPSRSHEQLLRVVFGPEPGENWRQWLQGRDIDELEYPAYRLLPLVVFEGREIAQWIPPRIKGFHRFCWTRNQVRLRALREVLPLFNAEGIGVLAYKDLPLVLDTYPDIGARPLEMLDLYVRPQELAPAAALFEKLGWATNFSRERLTVQAQTVSATGKIEVQLGCAFPGLAPLRRLNEEIWAEQRTVARDGLTFSAPCRSDQLFLLLLRAVRFSQQPSWDWVPDALLLLQGSTANQPEFWARFGELTRRYHYAALLFDPLDYLRRQWQAGVPESLLADLAQTPLKRIYRIEADNRQRVGNKWTRLTDSMAEHARLAEFGAKDQKVSLPGFLLRTRSGRRMNY